MSAEHTTTDPTAPVAHAPKDGLAKPDNQFNDGTPTAVADTATTAQASGSGTVKPNNQFNDSAPKG